MNSSISRLFVLALSLVSLGISSKALCFALHGTGETFSYKDPSIANFDFAQPALGRYTMNEVGSAAYTVSEQFINMDSYGNLDNSFFSVFVDQSHLRDGKLKNGFGGVISASPLPNAKEGFSLTVTGVPGRRCLRFIAQIEADYNGYLRLVKDGSSPCVTGTCYAATAVAKLDFHVPLPRTPFHMTSA